MIAASEEAMNLISIVLSGLLDVPTKSIGG
jgi:hypothetical protein